MHSRFNAAFTALLAAALFGATTPLAKTLLGSLSPFMVAGLFHLGSGIGLAATLLAQRLKRSANERGNEIHIRMAEVPWLLGAIAAGGHRRPGVSHARPGHDAGGDEFALIESAGCTNGRHCMSRAAYTPSSACTDHTYARALPGHPSPAQPPVTVRRLPAAGSTAGAGFDRWRQVPAARAMTTGMDEPVSAASP